METGTALAIMFTFPFVFWMTVRLGRYAYLMANLRFEEYHGRKKHGEE